MTGPREVGPGDPGSQRTPSPPPENGSQNGVDLRLGDKIFSRKTILATGIALAILAITSFRVLDIDWGEM